MGFLFACYFLIYMTADFESFYCISSLLVGYALCVEFPLHPLRHACAGRSSLLGIVLALSLWWTCLALSKAPWDSGRVELYLPFFITHSVSCSVWGVWLTNNGKIFKLEPECPLSHVPWKEEEKAKEQVQEWGLCFRSPHLTHFVTPQPTGGLAWS